MKKNIIFDFLSSGKEIFKEKRQFFSLFICLNFFNLIGILYGFLSNDILLKNLSVIMLFIFVVATISLFIIILRKEGIKNNALARAIIFFELYIETVLFIIILCGMLSYNMSCLVFIIPSILIIIVYAIQLISKIKKNREYFSPNKSSRSIRLYSLLGGTAGIFIARTLIDESDQNKALNILLICMALYSCFIGVSMFITFAKAFFVACMNETDIIGYVEYLYMRAENEDSNLSMQYLGQAILALNDLPPSNLAKNELLYKIEQLKKTLSEH